MRVRDYELDQFGVVNNAVYSSYIQHARHDAFSALGLHIDSFTQGGGALALSNLSLTFLAPLRSRDVFEVEVWVERITAARLILGQSITLKSAARASTWEKVSCPSLFSDCCPTYTLAIFALEIFKNQINK